MEFEHFSGVGKKVWEVYENIVRFELYVIFVQLKFDVKVKRPAIVKKCKVEF